ncbi:hypothetical protein SRABI106_03320 [Rahnella aquatilis]|nr:hypothetical protein SRABI106_03320 [Rahnella aquatilis]
MRNLRRFNAHHGFISVIRHISHAHRQCRTRIPGHHIGVIFMCDNQRTFQNRINDFAGGLRLGVDAVSLAREGQITVFLLGFCAIDFINKAVAQAFNSDIGDVANVEIGVQGAVGFEITGRLQLDVAGCPEREACRQRECMRP